MKNKIVVDFDVKEKEEKEQEEEEEEEKEKKEYTIKAGGNEEIQVTVRKTYESVGAGAKGSFFEIKIGDIGVIKKLNEKEYDKTFKTEMKKHVKVGDDGEGSITITEEEFNKLKSQIASDFGIEPETSTEEENTNEEETIIGKEKDYYVKGNHEEKGNINIQILVTEEMRSVGMGASESFLNIKISYETIDETRIQDCSDSSNADIKEACSHCVNYVKLIYKAVKETDVKNFKTYVPYINRVTDHWFRNVYFTKNSIGADRIVQNDNEYEQKTGERWTLYETDEKRNYQLYVYLKENGEYKTEFKEEDDKWLVCKKVEAGKGDYELADDGITYQKASGGEYKLQWKDAENNYSDYGSTEDEFRVGKRAVENTDVTSDYLAYEIGQSDDSWQKVEVNEESPNSLQDLEQLGQNIYYKTAFGTVKQVEDGVRGETNAKIKKLFLDDYYLYDGTKETAALIEEAKKMADANIVAKKAEEVVNADNMVDSAFESIADLILYDRDDPDNFPKDKKIEVDLVTDQDDNIVNSEMTLHYDKDKSKGDTIIFQLLNDEDKIVKDNISISKANPNNETVQKRAEQLAEKLKEEIEKDYSIEEGADQFSTVMSRILQPTGVPSDVIIKCKPKGSNSEVKTQHYTATIDQISGPISLSHSSLTAFSMLENMHTLDSEFIYRDFKELIVELNYFDKEDLVEAESEVMMFPVSGISAAGWPVARYDKTEKYGTLIHSAEDLRALRKQTEAELQEIIDAENGPPEEEEDVTQNVNPSTSETVTPANGGGDTSYANASGLNDKQKMILQAAEDLHYYLENNGYDYSLTSANLKNSLEESISNNSRYVCCGTFIGWTAQALGMQFTMSHGSLTVNENIFNEVAGVEEISVNDLEDFKNKLQPGDVVWRPRSEGQGHTQIFVGFDESGNFLWYNCGSSDSVKKAQPYQSSYEVDKYQKIYRWTGCELSYNGMSSEASSSSEAEFAGFEGGETVVSPVTGEVVEYGTTTRKNIETSKIETDGESTNNQSEEVGFIKIRLLGNEDWQQSKSKEGCQYFTGLSKSSIQGSITGNDVDEGNATSWLESKYTEEELKTLGYDYFWEEYNDAGIGDHYLYIEGFDVSDVNVSGGGNKQKEKNKENIQTLAEFISKLENGDEESEEDSGLTNSYSTQYVVPNLLDDKREFELKIAEAAKEKAAFTYTKDGKVYIKEGAAIGKTYDSDSDFIKEIEIEEPETEEEEGNNNQDQTQNNPTVEENDQNTTTVEEDENTGPYKVGNYLRVIFRDTGEQVVENVEDYVERSDSETKSNAEIDWELLYFIPYEGGGIDGPEAGPEAVKNESMSNGNFDVGIIQWTTNDTLKRVQYFCEEASKRNPGLCSGLAKYKDMDNTQIRQQNIRDEIQDEFTKICNQDRDGFLQLQVEIAKEGYLDPVIANNPWLAEAPSVVQGTVMSSNVYQGTGNVPGLQQGNDKLNIETAIGRFPSSLAPRKKGQLNAANDILSKSVTEAEIEEWVRTKTSPSGKSWGEH